MRLTNDRYLITLRAGRGVELYYRDGARWVKRSTRGRKFEATAEQVLNHLLPALAGVNPRVSVSVEHSDLSERAAALLEGLRTTACDSGSSNLTESGAVWPRPDRRRSSGPRS